MSNTGIFLIGCGAILAVFVIGYTVDYFLEDTGSKETCNVNIDFRAMLEQHRRELPEGSLSTEDTGVIRLRDMARVFAEQDAEIGKRYVDSLKQRLIQAGTYS